MFVDAPAWMRGGVAANVGVEWMEEGPDQVGPARERALLERRHV
jgi:hypothetical protein